MNMNTFEVKMEWFYKDDTEKTKMNWFCYEYACDLYDFIRASNRLVFFVKKRSKKEIAKFCEHFSKRIKENISDKLLDLSDIASVCEKHISEYFPRNIQMENEFILDAAIQAFSHTKSACSTCSEKCFENPDAHSRYFDRYSGGIH